jgi:hypothetical protein
MTSSASSVAWLPAAVARAAVVTPAVHAARPGRHSAPEVPGQAHFVVGHAETVAARAEHAAGRHAEPTWSRQLFDPSRDEDVFDWLGFSA